MCTELSYKTLQLTVAMQSNQKPVLIIIRITQRPLLIIYNLRAEVSTFVWYALPGHGMQSVVPDLLIS